MSLIALIDTGADAKGAPHSSPISMNLKISDTIIAALIAAGIGLITCFSNRLR